MTDITFSALVTAEDRRLDLSQDQTETLFEPADPELLAEELRKIAENRVQVATDAANLRLGC